LPSFAWARSAIGLAFVSVVIYWSVAVLSTLAIETGMQRVLDNNQMKAKWINKEAIICFFPAIVLPILFTSKLLQALVFELAFLGEVSSIK